MDFENILNVEVSLLLGTFIGILNAYRVKKVRRLDNSYRYFGKVTSIKRVTKHKNKQYSWEYKSSNQISSGG